MIDWGEHQPFSRLLRPALRYALRKGFAFRQIKDAVEEELVALAGEELRKRGEKVTDSRLSVMTGVGRAKIRALKDQTQKAVPKEDLVAKVLGHWQGKKEFLSKKGRPRPLTYGSEESEFSKLVDTVTADVHAFSVLSELERLRLVSTDENHVRLECESYFDPSDERKSASLLARNLETLTEISQENLLFGRTDPHAHIRTEYNNIYIADVPEVRRGIYQMVQNFHREVRTFLARHDADLTDTKDEPAGRRAVVITGAWTERGEA